MNLIFAGVATALLVARALSRKSLTLSGILAAVLTAAVHAVHPWNLPFVLLITFYGLGTAATKVKHDVKAKLTLSSSGALGGESARNHIQVLANSIAASVLLLLHAKQLGVFTPGASPASACFSNRPDDLLIIGVIANYAATLADTLSSELGILSRSPPRLITTLRETPRGTNGGVTLYGVGVGAAGAGVLGVVAAALLPGCEGAWGLSDKVWFVGFVGLVGMTGSLLDSVLGALFQQSVVDVRSRKIVEAPNGAKVLVVPEQQQQHRTSESRPQKQNSRVVITAHRWGVLSNNQVNLVMAVTMSLAAMVVWGGLGRMGAVVGEQLRTVVKTVIKQELAGAFVRGVLGV